MAFITFYVILINIIIDYWVGVSYCYRGTLLHEILANFFQIFEKSLLSALLI